MENDRNKDHVIELTMFGERPTMTADQACDQIREIIKQVVIIDAVMVAGKSLAFTIAMLFETKDQKEVLDIASTSIGKELVAFNEFRESTDLNFSGQSGNA